MRACSLAALLMAAAAASAGDGPEAPTLTIAEVRQLEAVSDDQWGKAYALIGPLRLEFGEVFRLRARRCVIWLDPKAGANVVDLVGGLRATERRIPVWAVRALYAEGGRAPVLFHTSGRVFRCASVFFDFSGQRGLLVDAELRLRRTDPDAGEMPDLVVRAKRIRGRGAARWTAEDARVFSTDYVDPEVLVEVGKLEISNPSMQKILGEITRLSEAGRKAGEGVPQSELDAVLADLNEEAVRGTDTRLDFHEITARVLGVRILRWGRLEADMDAPLDLRVEAELGDRGRLDNGGWLGVGLGRKPIGFLIGAGYYHRRGTLLDLDVTVDAFDSALTGESISSYLDDHDESQPTDERFWSSHRYRWEISETLRLDGELAALSDANWLLTYDERVFKEGKAQETLLHLRRRGTWGYISLVGKARTIDFQREVEELPRLSASLPNFTLFSTQRLAVQVAVNAEVGNLRLRFPKGSIVPDLRTVRFDVDPTFFVAFQLGAVRVVPYVTTRFTAWEETLGGGSLSRFAGSGGVRADVQLWRWFGRRRHVMNISFEYTDMFTVSESASRFFPIDAVDAVTPYEVLSIRFRNRLQQSADDGIETFLTFEIFGAWFPDGRQPLGRTGDGFLDFSLAWWRGEEVGIGLHADVNPELGELSAGAVEGWWRANPNVRLGAGFRHLQDDSDIVTLTAATDIDSRWRVTVFSQYDFRNSESLDQGLLLERLGKTAVFGLRLTYDPGDGDFGLSFKIDLLEAFRKRRGRRDHQIRLTEFTAR